MSAPYLFQQQPGDHLHVRAVRDQAVTTVHLGPKVAIRVSHRRAQEGYEYALRQAETWRAVAEHILALQTRLPANADEKAAADWVNERFANAGPFGRVIPITTIAACECSHAQGCEACERGGSVVRIPVQRDGDDGSDVA